MPQLNGTTFSAKSVPQLIEALYSLPEENRDVMFSWFMKCATHFPDVCTNVVSKMEERIVRSLLDSDMACEAYGYLAHCGPAGGNMCMSYTLGWTICFNKLHTTISEYLDELYGFIESTNASVEKEDKPAGIKFPTDLPEDEPERTNQLQARIIAMCSAMAHMFRDNFPGPVINVNVNSVVQLVSRITAISPNFLLKRPSQQRIRLASVVPSLHIAALNILNALVSLDTPSLQLIRMSSSIEKIFSEGFLWISQMQAEVMKPGVPSLHSDIHLALWDSLRIWVEALGGRSGVEHIAEDVLVLAAPYITPSVETSGESNGKLNAKPEVVARFHGKKGKKKGYQNSNAVTATSSDKPVDVTADWKLIIAIWQATAIIIKKVGHFISSKCYEDVIKILIKILGPVRPAIPYSHPKALCATLSTLEVCIAHPHPECEVPVQSATKIFSRFYQDAEVRKQCEQGDVACKLIAQARVPRLCRKFKPDEDMIPRSQQGQQGDQPNSSKYVLSISGSNPTHPSKSYTELVAQYKEKATEEDSKMEEDEENKDKVESSENTAEEDMVKEESESESEESDEENNDAEKEDVQKDDKEKPGPSGLQSPKRKREDAEEDMASKRSKLNEEIVDNKKESPEEEEEDADLAAMMDDLIPE